MIFLEVPQGFAKKIEIELLLPDFLLQFPDPAPGLCQCLFLRCWHIDRAVQLCGPVNSCCPGRTAAPT
ncbi:hypothetical protein NKJ36_29920 [Mesorhizobium sp. M0142]|uniref:hypothetical protein n=1 Tax=Mesorhizobium sp. M0142 TaxID=2956894 RepID=UPI00333633BF